MHQKNFNVSKRVRTRFAPSPTGLLHLGGVRTAVFSWAFARHFGGDFILRIEDTDLKRSTQQSTQSILDSLHWLGLEYEGPYYQTQRMNVYRQYIDRLLATGTAYRCSCSMERLETLRSHQETHRIKPHYDRHCLHHPIAQQDTYVIRFKNPDEGSVHFCDLVYGPITIQNSELDDVILARESPAGLDVYYNFSAAIDDWDMGITHVIRGDDHINNTPRQINILHALGAELPVYAHVPMILGSDGKRFSKRHGAMSVLEYKKQGILKEAFLNYLIRLGFSHHNKELFSQQEIIDLFDGTHIHCSPASFDLEKLLWFNQQYMKTLPVSETIPILKAHVQKHHVTVRDDFDWETLWRIQVSRSKSIEELVEKSIYFFTEPVLNSVLCQQYCTNALYDPLNALCKTLSGLLIWTQESIHQALHEVIQSYGLSFGALSQAVRVALTGGTVSPPIDATVYLLGLEWTTQRIVSALNTRTF